MTATYTWDIFCSLDGYGSHHGDWGGYWGKQGPELLEHRDAQYVDGLRMVLGATTYREFVQMRGSSADGSGVEDAWVTRMRSAPLTVVASSLEEPRESDVPLRSHGSLSLNWALMAAGLVDRLQVTVFPVITGRTGNDPILGGAGDFDLELLESRTLDGRTQELVYRPTPH